MLCCEPVETPVRLTSNSLPMAAATALPWWSKLGLTAAVALRAQCGATRQVGDAVVDPEQAHGDRGAVQFGDEHVVVGVVDLAGEVVACEVAVAGRELKSVDVERLAPAQLRLRQPP